MFGFLSGAASHREPTAEAVLRALLAATPALTSDAPRDARGIYGLVDHDGKLRYVGSTSAANETLYKRIHQRHRTGSEGGSHYFSRMYNTGRMWRDPKDQATKSDGDTAKRLRNAFIAKYCGAVWVVVPDSVDIGRLEQDILAIAPAHAIAWNRRGMEIYEEPVALVDETITSVGLTGVETAAIARQLARYASQCASPLETSPAAAMANTLAMPEMPTGPFQFAALDVETANNDRASICQVGVAFVRPDQTMDTWVTYVDTQTDNWQCSFIHGICGQTVRGAPRFAEVVAVLDEALSGLTVYQHSSFDRSAIHAACDAAGLERPAWQWRDSVQTARAAWPELKGNGGHGLASLKTYLGLKFRHHDAGEDARASAEIVLLAEAGFHPIDVPGWAVLSSGYDEDDDVIEPFEVPLRSPIASGTMKPTPGPTLTANDVAQDRAGKVPYAADGTCFHAGLERKGLFTIGPKGAETKHLSFEEALAALRCMNSPRWRRPNTAGNWGIVVGREWK